VELLVVIAITVILVAVAVPLYGNLQVSAQLNERSAELTQTLRSAQERAASGVNDASHGLKLFSDRYVFYQGDSYDTRASAYDRNIKFDSSLTLTTDLSGEEINFNRAGIPNKTGKIILQHAVNGNRTITINNLGAVAEE